MRPLVVATRNRGKLYELRAMFAATDLEVIDVAEAEVRLGVTIPDTVEDAPTFVGNAGKKAREVAGATGWPALADDSGLEVDALGGAPGVYSARYAGGHGDTAANNAKLLAALVGVPPERRTAQFRCVLAVADPAGLLGGELMTAEGVVRGTLLEAPRGTGGFGYDPLFFSPELGLTFAEADRDAKAAVSHRGRALASLLPHLQTYLALGR